MRTGFARRGLTAIEIAIVVVVMLAVLLIGAFTFRRAVIRRDVARVRMDLRKVATAIEAYYVDCSIYPAWAMGAPTEDGIVSYNWRVAQKTGNLSGVADLPSFAESTSPSAFCTLSKMYAFVGGKGFTPIPMPTTVNVTTSTGSFTVAVGSAYSYFKSYPRDLFCADRGATCVYWSIFPGDRQMLVLSETPVGGVGWIQISPGPDRDYDLAGEYSVYDPSVPQPSAALLYGTNAAGSALTNDPTNGLVSDGDIWRLKM